MQGSRIEPVTFCMAGITINPDICVLFMNLCNAFRLWSLTLCGIWVPNKHTRMYFNDFRFKSPRGPWSTPAIRRFFVLERILQLFPSVNPLLGFCLPVVSEVRQFLSGLALFWPPSWVPPFSLSSSPFQPVSPGALLPGWQASSHCPSEQLASGSTEPGFGHELW